MEHKTWNDVIKINSNGGDIEIDVVITVPRARSFFAFYELFEKLQLRYANLFELILRFNDFFNENIWRC